LSAERSLLSASLESGAFLLEASAIRVDYGLSPSN